MKKFDDGDFLIILLYVDDMLIVGQDQKKIESLKKALSKSFAMKDMGQMKQILGIHSPGSHQETIMVVTGEVCDKGASKVPHGGCETGRVDTADQLQVLLEAKS